MRTKNGDMLKARVAEMDAVIKFAQERKEKWESWLKDLEANPESSGSEPEKAMLPVSKPPVSEESEVPTVPVKPEVG